MQTRIREVRKAKGLTLQEVASRCAPPTTAQTIGRLETGTRTVSMGWLNRIARALDVDPSELVHLPDRPDIPVAAVLGASGVESPRRVMVLAAPKSLPDLIGMTVEVSQGDYRAGDEVWLTRLAPPDYARCLNKDVLVPLPARKADADYPLDDGNAGVKPATQSSATGNDALHSHNGQNGDAPASDLLFGRLISITAKELQVVPLAWGAQPVTLPTPDWLAVVSTLIRRL